MSVTLTLPYVRFTRQYHTAPAANTMWLATLASAIGGLKAAPWQLAAIDTKAGMPVSDPTKSFSSQGYDAFKASGDAANSMQAAYVGMACYRFKVPADALAGTPANVVSVALEAYADKFLWKGLRISAYLSGSDAPSADWDFLRAGDVATPVDAGGAGVLPEPNPATKLASNKGGTCTLAPAAALNPQAYLFVVVQLEAWSDNKYEYWIEGSGMIDAASVSVTFDRSVTPDAPAALPNAEMATFTAVPLDMQVSDYGGGDTTSWAWSRLLSTQNAFPAGPYPTVTTPYAGTDGGDLNGRVTLSRLIANLAPGNVSYTLSVPMDEHGDSYFGSSEERNLLQVGIEAKRFLYTAPVGRPPNYLRIVQPPSWSPIVGINRIVVLRELPGYVESPLLDLARVQAMYLGTLPTAETAFAICGQLLVNPGFTRAILEIPLSGVSDLIGHLWIVLLPQAPYASGDALAEWRTPYTYCGFNLDCRQVVALAK